MSETLLFLVLVGQPAVEPADAPDAVSGAATTDGTPATPTIEPPGPPTPDESPIEPATSAPTPLAGTSAPLPTMAQPLPLVLALSLRASPTPADGVPRAWGPVLEGRWLVPAPFFFSAALGLNRSWSANDSWQFSRTSLIFLGSAGISTTRGAGRFFVSLSLGGETIFERKGRQGNSGLSDTPQGRARWRYTVGPYVAAEVGASICFWGPIGVEVGFGPALSIQKVLAERRTTVGLHSRVGISYAF